MSSIFKKPNNPDGLIISIISGALILILLVTIINVNRRFSRADQIIVSTNPDTGKEVVKIKNTKTDEQAKELSEFEKALIKSKLEGYLEGKKEGKEVIVDSTYNNSGNNQGNYGNPNVGNNYGNQYYPYGTQYPYRINPYGPNNKLPTVWDYFYDSVRNNPYLNNPPYYPPSYPQPQYPPQTNDPHGNTANEDDNNNTTDDQSSNNDNDTSSNDANNNNDDNNTNSSDTGADPSPQTNPQNENKLDDSQIPTQYPGVQTPSGRQHEP